MSQVAAEFDSEAGANFSLSASAANLSTPVASNIFLAASFYGQSLITSFNYNRNSQEEYEDACALESTDDVAYHNGSAAYPVADDSVFRNHMLNSAAYMRYLTLGLILVLVLRFNPKGLIPEK